MPRLSPQPAGGATCLEDGMTTGYDEAREWLAAHAPEWRIMQGEVALRPAYTIGGPTMQHVSVTLGQPPHVSGDLSDGRYIVNDPDVSLMGEGATFLEAVQNAVGGLIRAGYDRCDSIKPGTDLRCMRGPGHHEPHQNTTVPIFESEWT